MTNQDSYGMTAAQMNRATSDLGSARDEFNRLNRIMVEDIRGLKTRFEGQGGAAFQKLGEQWDLRYTEINNVLDRFGESIGVNLKLATDRDSEAAGNISSLANNPNLNHG